MPPFFGLTTNDKEIFLEHIFLLMYYMGFTYDEAYNLPVWQRIWFINRVNSEIKKANDSRAAQHNDPQTRALKGKMRSQVPAKLRRFT